MIYSCMQFVIILGAIAQLRTAKLCHLDTGKVEKMASIKENKIYVISLSNKNSCAAFNMDITFNFDNAERKCSMLSGGSLLKPENTADLKANKARYDQLPTSIWYLYNAEKGKCHAFEKRTGIIVDIACNTMMGFICQYPYQYNCAYEIVAKIDQTNIVYEMAISQNSDATGKLCSPTVPKQKKCLGGEINPWGVWSDCSQDCTATRQTPPTKYRLQNILCKNTDLYTTVFNNATCNTELLCQNGPGKTATSGNEGIESTNVLMWVIVGLAVLVVILSVVLGVLWHFRKSFKKSSCGQSAKSVVGVVPNVQGESNVQAIDESATPKQRERVSPMAGTSHGVRGENDTDRRPRGQPKPMSISKTINFKLWKMRNKKNPKKKIETLRKVYS